MTEDDRSGAFKGPRKLCFSWPSKQRHLENTLKVKGNEKLDHVNCALCKYLIYLMSGGQFLMEKFWWKSGGKVVENIRWKFVGEKYLVEHIGWNARGPVDWGN